MKGDRLISLNAAIDALGEEPLLWEAEDDYTLGQLTEWRRYKEALEALPSAQPEPRWIPCSEKLPERYYNYLITTGEGDTDIGTFSPELSRWYICDADGFKRAEYVLAWMPLPEPYKGE